MTTALILFAILGHSPANCSFSRLSDPRIKSSYVSSVSEKSPGLTVKLVDDSAGNLKKKVGSQPLEWVGGDVSEIPQEESLGVQYCNKKGQPEDPFLLMKQAGWTAVRFRVWVHPKGGWCGSKSTLKVAKQAFAAGLHVIVDFHYSNWWADPGKQYTPVQWSQLSFPVLVKKVHDYTYNFVEAMVKQGTPPQGVQIGNEITHGMLWPDGKLDGSRKQWKRFGELVQAGLSAVREVNSPTKIYTCIHIDRGGDPKGAQAFVDHLRAQGVRWDALGLSYYPWWHGPLSALNANLHNLAKRYKFMVYVAETAYPWEIITNSRHHELFDDPAQLIPGFPANPIGEADFLKKVMRIEQTVPNTIGILYWAPTWVSTKTRRFGYDNLALFKHKGGPESNRSMKVYPLPAFFAFKDWKRVATH